MRIKETVQMMELLFYRYLILKKVPSVGQIPKNQYKNATFGV